MTINSPTKVSFLSAIQKYDERREPIIVVKLAATLHMTDSGLQRYACFAFAIVGPCVACVKLESRLQLTITSYE